MRKFFLIGIIVTILLAVPLTVYLLTTQKTTPNINAAPSTLMAFTIPSQPATVGTPVAIPVTVDPTNGGSTSSPNQVSFIKVVIQYDGTKLQAASSYFVPDQKLSTLETPTNSCDSNNNCTISATLSTGADPTNTITSQATIATLNFNPLVPTDPNNPTKLTFGSGSQALSIASSDKPAENVLAISRLQPGALTITGAAVTETPTPTTGGSGTTGTGGTGTGGTGTTSAPITCSSFTADNTTATTAPFTVLLTATGNSTAGNITKVSFNFGDGNVQDIASGSGIGTNNVSVQQSHIYQTTGTFTATAVFTDDQGNTTTPSSCSQTITIGGGTPTPTPTVASSTSATPTIPPTGPGNVFLSIGAVGLVVTVVGIFFAIGI